MKDTLTVVRGSVGQLDEELLTRRLADHLGEGFAGRLDPQSVLQEVLAHELGLLGDPHLIVDVLADDLLSGGLLSVYVFLSAQDFTAKDDNVRLVLPAFLGSAGTVDQ